MALGKWRSEKVLAFIRWRPGKLIAGTYAMTMGMGMRTIGQSFVFLVVARILGVGDYGTYAAVVALAMTFGAISGLGTSIVMMRETARDGSFFEEKWGHALAALVVTTPILTIIFGLISWWVLPKQISLFVIFCVGVAEIVMAPFTSTCILAYQGQERIGRAARLVLAPIVPRLIASLLLIASVLLLPVTNRLEVWAILYLMAAVSSSTYAIWLIKQDLRVALRLSWWGLLGALHDGWPFSFSEAAQKIYSDIDKVMLASLSTLESTGAYSASYRLIEMVSVPLLSFFSATAPRFYREGRKGVKGSAHFALKILPLPLFYSLLISVLLFVVAGEMPLLLGQGFITSVGVLRWLAWLPILVTLRRFMQTALMAGGRQRAIMLVVIFGALLNIGLNLWAIPLWSWMGAVLSTYVSEFAMSIMLLIILFIFQSES